MSLSVENPRFEEEEVTEVENGKLMGKVFYCEKCGLITPFKENEVAICQNCRRPLEIRILTTIRELSGRMVGKRLLIKAVIGGESQIKSLPSEVEATCDICGAKLEVNLNSSDPTAKRILEHLFFSRKSQVESIITSMLPRGQCKTRDGHKWLLEFKSFLDFSFARVQDLIEFEDQQYEAETRSVTGILLDKTDIKNGVLDCEVIIGPDNSLTLLIYRVNPLEFKECELKPEDIEEIRIIFQGKNLKQLEPLIDRVVAPEIRGRVKAKIAAALCALSVKWITFKAREPVPGTLRVFFIGGPRLGKGGILRWFVRKGIAGHAVGETSTRTGLSYSIDPDMKILTWGVLPRNDGRMVSLEALHGLSSEEMSRLREILAQSFIEVHRVVEGRAWCRVRILADANPRQPSITGNYPFAGLSLLDCKPFQDVIDLTRWDLFVPFRSEDVTVEEMYAAFPIASEEEERAFLNLVRFAWSLNSSNIKMDEAVLKKARVLFNEILAAYGSELIPIVHTASFWTLLRIAVAIAILEFSTEDGKNITVTERHIDEACEFWRGVLDDLELEEIKKMFEESEPSTEEKEEIERKLKENDLTHLFLEILKKPGDLDELAGRLGISKSTVKRKASELKALGLIVRGASGYKATKKGNIIFKHICELFEPFEPSFKGGRVEIESELPENRAQRAQRAHEIHPRLLGFYKDEALCELCNAKVSSYNKVALNNRILIVCDKCFKELKDGNDAPADNYLKEEDDG